MSDFQRFLHAGTEVERRMAAYDAAAAHLEVAKIRRNIAHLLSQHQPVATLGVDREALRHALRFIEHGDEARCLREIAAAPEAR